jgi:DNA polymerase III delta prime subunit
MVCNHVSGIIPALISRCTRFKFSKIRPEDAIGRLECIAKEENLILGPGIIQAVYEISDGDMRQCVNTL